MVLQLITSPFYGSFHRVLIWKGNMLPRHKAHPVMTITNTKWEIFDRGFPPRKKTAKIHFYNQGCWKTSRLFQTALTPNLDIPKLNWKLGQVNKHAISISLLNRKEHKQPMATVLSSELWAIYIYRPVNWSSVQLEDCFPVKIWK